MGGLTPLIGWRVIAWYKAEVAKLGGREGGGGKGKGGS